MATTTVPQISIYTLNPGPNACSITFDYLPESVNFSVTANYTDQPFPFTAIRMMIYSHTVIDAVNLTIKVVAGCNNAITFLSQTNGGSDPGQAVTYTRNSLIKIAQYLSSLALPLTNSVGGANTKPPPSCRLTVGPFFSCVGGFTNIGIKYNGPYDFDGSPTDMEVTIGFLASQMYNSDSNLTGMDVTPEKEAAAAGALSQTMSGSTELTGQSPYVVWVSQSNTTPTGEAIVAPTLPGGNSSQFSDTSTTDKVPFTNTDPSTVQNPISSANNP
jgi:hypothetical protein